MIECIKIKADKCIACRRCEVACIAAHHNMTFKEAMKHRDVLVARVQVIKTHEMKTSVRCHQCEHAPCCNVCPTGALKQMESGVIDFHEELCIACEMCIKACPYGTIELDAPAHCNLQQEEAENSAPPRAATCAANGAARKARKSRPAWRSALSRPFTCLSLTAM